MGKIGFKTLEVSGFVGAFHGMRAPMQSYHLSDSEFNDKGNPLIGEKDMNLAMRLNNGGNEHSKYRRMIHVQVEISMPRYWWSEMDTYKVATTANSESTMHKLLNNDNPITEDQFYFGKDELVANYVREKTMDAINELENLRQQYKGLKETKFTKNQLLTIAKRILPECFIQTRTYDCSYQTVYEQVRQRVKIPHRLREEWVECFGKWVDSLPYTEELIKGD